jgi:DNA helicase-2/ATP-dependent DNA helicase PcrA
MAFTEEQLKAVNFDLKKDSIVNAGAGSGKTTSMVGRVSKLIREGENPSSIFVSTFTKSASLEMIGRLNKSVGKVKASRVRIGTTHSLFYKLLKECHMHSNRPKNFKILMDGKKYMFFLDLLKRNEWHCKAPHTYMGNISLLKNQNVSAIEYAQHLAENPMYKGQTPKNTSALAICQGYLAYDEYVRKNNLIDFDDMLFRSYRDMSDPKHEAFLKSIRKAIKHIIIDEAQDLNLIQYNLIELISGSNRNIMLIGDDFQAIYGWRGSELNYLFDFIKRKNPEIINITRNYRCPPAVVNASNALISRNLNQISKVLVPNKEMNHAPEVLFSVDPEEEAQVVIDKLNEVFSLGYEFGDVAILYRTNAQSRPFVDMFESYEIPYNISSDITF